MIASRSIFFTVAILQPQQCFSQRDSEMLSHPEFPFFNAGKIGYPGEIASSHVWGPTTEMAWTLKKSAEMCLKMYCVSLTCSVCEACFTRKGQRKDQFLLVIVYKFRLFQNQIWVWGQRWGFLVLMGIRSGASSCVIRLKGPSQDIRQKYEQLVTWKVVLLRLHESQWWMKRLSVHLLLTMLSPRTNALHAQHPHTPRSPLFAVTDELTHWRVKYGGNSQSARAPRRRWRLAMPLQVCWKCLAEDKRRRSLEQGASLCGEVLVVVMFEQRRWAPIHTTGIKSVDWHQKDFLFLRHNK